ncbi:MAG: DUF2309 domain-containing protein [Bdellovibrionaceae bacterium]|nr:DUF2309 domain-containing protein [Pseudobdellovibrionaceae bacterium]
MQQEKISNSLKETLHKLHHYLPSQGPLRDFIHHNTLHAFQNQPFHEGIQLCSQIFGSKVYLSFSEYQKMYKNGDITDAALEKTLKKRGNEQIQKNDLLRAEDNKIFTKRIGSIRSLWKEKYQLDIDHRTQPLLFRYLSSYLDQGVSHWWIPTVNDGFLKSMRDLDNNPFSSLFFCSRGRARKWLQDEHTSLENLLKILVGDESLFENYLFDQQFSHPGWSGIVSYIEHEPHSLLNSKKITLQEVVLFELLLEIDYLDHNLGINWKPLASFSPQKVDLFAPLVHDQTTLLMSIWQEAMEDSFYNSVLSTIQHSAQRSMRDDNANTLPKFQAFFCIDDREISLRHYLEQVEPEAETFGTPGFFGVEFYFRPDRSSQITKLCPAPITPKYLIRESNSRHSFKKDILFHHETHSFVGGWLISQTIGFWSAGKLFLNIFKPSLSPATATSLRHTDTASDLTIEHQAELDRNLQVGYTLQEMVERVYNTLMSVGLTHNFAEVIYLVGHGASSVNNPHYAAYDCGACSGRPGSVNARIFAYMANKANVREKLQERNIHIPSTTIFIGAIHDTTRDEIEFYDESRFSLENNPIHIKAKRAFLKALEKNAKERCRRFDIVPLSITPQTANEHTKQRSVSLFEPRPELNHATNALCIVGGRHLTKNVFLDRRAFLNSYDPHIDPQGEILTRILNAAVPVCGGINLEYYFSRVDNLKLGAGTKLPHNVVGLIAVANGADGDLRPGLPSQMIEIHDPLRLLLIVEHSPEVALAAVQRNPATYEWVKNSWVLYSCIDPKDLTVYVYCDGKMEKYNTSTDIFKINNIDQYVTSSRNNLKIGIFEDINHES